MSTDADDDILDEPEPTPGIVELTGVELAVLTLDPALDHTLVILTDDHLDQRQRVGVKMLLGERFPEHAGVHGERVLILDAGKRLAVVSQAKKGPMTDE